MAPHINNLYFLTLCQKYGTYFVVQLLFWIKLLLSIGMLLIGVQHMWMVGLFIARWVVLYCTTYIVKMPAYIEQLKAHNAYITRFFLPHKTCSE